MFEYFKLLVKPGSGNSSKSFALVISSVIGAIIALSVAFAIIYDVLIDGIINTNLDDLGWFLICVGVYSFGSGAGKVITDTVSFRSKKASPEPEQLNKEEKQTVTGIDPEDLFR